MKDVCRELGSLSAKKKLAAQKLPRVKIFMGELGSSRAEKKLAAQNLPRVKIFMGELDSLSAEKKLAAQNPPREKLFKRELGSRRHYGYENAQKQASCERCLSGIGQSPRNQTANSPKLEEMRYI